MRKWGTGLRKRCIADCRISNIVSQSSIERAAGGASAIAKIEAGTAMNLYDDSDFYRAELFGPTIDYMQIIGTSETTTR